MKFLEWTSTSHNTYLKSTNWNDLLSGTYSVSTNVDSNLLSVYPNIYKWGTLYISPLNEESFNYQMYIPDHIDYIDSGIYIRTYYKGIQRYSDWECLHFNDYSSISLNKNGYIVFNNGLIIQWKTINLESNDFDTNKVFSSSLNAYLVFQTVTYALTYPNMCLFTTLNDLDTIVADLPTSDTNFDLFQYSIVTKNVTTNSTCKILWKSKYYGPGISIIFSIGY